MIEREWIPGVLSGSVDADAERARASVSRHEGTQGDVPWEDSERSVKQACIGRAGRLRAITHFGGHDVRIPPEYASAARIHDVGDGTRVEIRAVEHW
jgi:hypothetical protein